MKIWCGVFVDPTPSLMWAVVLYGSRHHPNASIRTQCESILWQVANAHHAARRTSDVVAVLEAAKGTALEPFVLSVEDKPWVALLASITLTGPIDAYRFRIVSRDSLNDKGGLVLTKRLRQYFAERYVHGRHQSVPSTGGFVAPGLEPKSSDVQHRLAPVDTIEQHADERGFAMEVQCAHSRDDILAAARSTMSLEVEDRSVPLAGRDVLVSTSHDTVTILACSPEGMMRVTAAAMQNGVLRLGDIANSWVIKIRLAVPDGKRRRVPYLVATRLNPFEHWLDLNSWPEPTVDRALQTNLAAWLVPANDQALEDSFV